MYIFHFVQSLGIFATTLSASIQIQEIIWVGIGLNCIASLIYIYEQLNNKIQFKLKNDIIAIMSNKYMFETPLADPNADVESIKRTLK